MPKDPSILLRETTAADRDACREVFDSNQPRYFQDHERDEFLAWLDQEDRGPYWVMEQAGEIVACGGIFHDPAENQVGLAWGMVRQDLHRQGLGRRLSQFRIQQLTEHYPGIEQRLGTSQHTFAFYERLGFRVVKVTRDGYGEGVDRVDMVR